jgi:epoxyqueuosine reductase
MQMSEEIEKEFFDELERHGYTGTIVSVKHIHELKRDIEEHNKLGHFDKHFFEERLSYFTFTLPENLPDAKSLIIVTVPQPQVQFFFNWKGKKIPLLVPPTYIHWRETDKMVERMVSGILSSEGYRVGDPLQVNLPKKLLAVRSGLVKYGRNNITYAPKTGSFHKLVVLFSDLPCKNDSWGDAQIMEDCEYCYACLNSCPTGAITEERFLLHAERCIVFHNERQGTIPFPQWINPSWHNCLVGCMECQKVCPKNKPFLDWIEQMGEFSEEETELFLRGASIDTIPLETKRKLELFDLTDLLDSFPRNLGVFLERL